MKDYYKILGLKSGASAAEIKKAFRTQALKFHPDRNSSPDATSKFIEINEAYAFLINPARRAAYGGKKKTYNQRKEAVYKTWVNKEQERVRRQAKEASMSSYEAFESKFIAGAAGCTSKAFNYLTFFIGLVFLMISWFSILYPDKAEMSTFSAVFLTIFGLVFIIGAWKFSRAEV